MAQSIEELACLDRSLAGKLDDAMDLLRVGAPVARAAELTGLGACRIKRWALKVLGPRRPGRTPASGIRHDPMGKAAPPKPPKPAPVSYFTTCAQCSEIVRVCGERRWSIVASAEGVCAIYEPHAHQPRG